MPEFFFGRIQTGAKKFASLGKSKQKFASLGKSKLIAGKKWILLSLEDYLMTQTQEKWGFRPCLVPAVFHHHGKTKM